nr:unnamed protein product [Digitaria exilis]
MAAAAAPGSAERQARGGAASASGNAVSARFPPGSGAGGAVGIWCAFGIWCCALSTLPQRSGEVNLTLGGIDLNNSGSVVVREDKKLLTVLFPDGRDGRAFTLKAETSEDLFEWKTALEEALAQAPNAALVMGHNGIFRIKVEGILRQAADVEEVDRRLHEYEQGKTEFSPEEDAHVVGDCVKHVLRELPSSPVPASCCTALLEAFRLEIKESRINSMRAAVSETFPEPNRRLLQRILRMMHTIASHTAENRMTPSAVAACMAPLLLRPLLAGECEMEDDFDMNGDSAAQLIAAANAANSAQGIVTTLLEEYENRGVEDPHASVEREGARGVARARGGREARGVGETRGGREGRELCVVGDHELRGQGRGLLRPLRRKRERGRLGEQSLLLRRRRELQLQWLLEGRSSSGRGRSSVGCARACAGRASPCACRSVRQQRRRRLCGGGIRCGRGGREGRRLSGGGARSARASRWSRGEEGREGGEELAAGGQPWRLARKGQQSELVDPSGEEELAIQRLEVAKNDLQIRIAKEVSRLQEQLQAERDLRAALEVGLSMSSSQFSSSRSMDSKTKAELEEIALAEADVARLKQKVAELHLQLNQQRQHQYGSSVDANDRYQHLPSHLAQSITQSGFDRSIAQSGFDRSIAF